MHLYVSYKLFIVFFIFIIFRRYQNLLDKSTIYPKTRWGVFVGTLSLYFLRVYLAQGWYIITYGLGIYLLNLFIGFLTPSIDPELDGDVLPTENTEEYRPFTRKVPEFKFWYSSMQATVCSIFMAMFRFFDVPVFWPILLLYFIMLFFMTMKKQIQHMVKHRYVPWSKGKTKYAGKEPLFTPGKGN